MYSLKEIFLDKWLISNSEGICIKKIRKNKNSDCVFLVKEAYVFYLGFFCVKRAIFIKNICKSQKIIDIRQIFVSVRILLIFNFS